MSTTKQGMVYNAILAEQTERYEDMVEQMKAVAMTATKENGLSVEERNLFSVAYKNVVGSRRAAWRILSSLKEKEIGKGNSEHVQRIEAYKVKVESELSGLCNEAIDLLNSRILPSASEDDGKVYYLKMKADYFRYMAEFSTAEQKSNAVESSESSYKLATELAEKSLEPTDAIRLGLALNYSVFLYEIKNARDDALLLAKKGFDEAIAKLDDIVEDGTYNDATLIMQLLRDNLQLWSQDLEDEEDEDDS
eukprot:TRINITY_DN1718_c0_g1_i1.p1 TRINITY_DN1718_c0_g1~~TRINITY_DN1718_c0_g1_i1.p1  ORF type:complete len:250 (+),score=59.16 TRINITY_DN1718_c0_g1_i1:104-853(+)